MKPTIVFMGTPEFAVPSLHALLENKYPVIAVVTAPDKPRGRGQRLSGTPVKELALQYAIPIFQPDSPRDPLFTQQMAGLQPDIIVVVAYRILPREVFQTARSGAFNLHASLLPKYRGAAPIAWAIINGETETGVTTFFLEEKVDTGNLILQLRSAIGPDDTADIVHDRLASLGAQAVLRTVHMIEQGSVIPEKQDDTQASPAPKIFRDDCRIDWNQQASGIHNRIRALSPRPGAFTLHHTTLLHLYRSKIVSGTLAAAPGTVRRSADELRVATGNGTIAITELQQEGKNRLSVEEFLRGYRIQDGDVLGG
jgi:methionyl-tRNA formyltransferase